MQGHQCTFQSKPGKTVHPTNTGGSVGTAAQAGYTCIRGIVGRVGCSRLRSSIINQNLSEMQRTLGESSTAAAIWFRNTGELKNSARHIGEFSRETCPGHASCPQCIQLSFCYSLRYAVCLVYGVYELKSIMAQPIPLEQTMSSDGYRMKIQKSGY